MEDEEVKEAITNPGGDGEGNGMPGMPGNMDDHEGWGEMTDEEADIVKSKIKKVTEAASKDCDRKGQWGSISSDVRKKIRESYQTEIPWQSVLRQFIGYSRRSNRITNVKRLSRKYPGIHPGTHRSYTASIAIYIDQSGSVSDTELALLFGELEGLARHTEFVCYHFDTSVDEESETIWRRGKTPEATRTRSGGTNFSAPSNHANKNSHRFDGYLILTDGWAPDPAHSKIRRGWIITPQGEAQEFMKNEITIKMQKEKDAN
jgi:predicted metal-dependent peptidase